MDIAIKKMFCNLLFLLLQLLDSLVNLFKILCGIRPVTARGEEMTLTELFLNSGPVVTAFMSIFVISGIVIMISIMVAVFKKILNVNEKRSHGKILWQGFMSIVTSLVMALVMFSGIFFSNTVLKLVDQATGGDEEMTLSKEIFDMSLRETGTTYIYKQVFEKDEFNNDTDIPAKDANGNDVWEYEVVRDGDGSWQAKPGGGVYSIDDITFGETDADAVFGVHRKTLGIFESEENKYLEDKMPMVELEDFNILVGYFAAIMLCIALIGSMLGLVKRLFDLVFLFLILPLVSGVIPLDDGARFKEWRSSVVSKVILAYGAVLAVNVFLLFLPSIMELSIGGSKFANTIFKLFLVVGGALSINGGQLLMARVFGTSAEESREMAQSARALAAGAATAVRLPGRAINAVAGQRMSDGQGGFFRAGGLLGKGGAVNSVGKLLGGATNLVGNAIAGEAYRRPAIAVTGGVKRATDAVANAFRGLTHLGYTPATASTAKQSILPAAQPASAGAAAGSMAAGVGSATPQRQNTPFKNGLVGAFVQGMVDVRQRKLSERNNGMLTPLDGKGIQAASPYVKPQANFTPKAATEKPKRGLLASLGKQRGDAESKPTSLGLGATGAIGAAKSKGADNNKGQYKRKK